MTTTQLIQNATAKGFKVNTENENLIGVNKGKFVWHWFDVLCGEVYFNHSYSQNTGATKKSTMHRINVQDSLGFYN